MKMIKKSEWVEIDKQLINGGMSLEIAGYEAELREEMYGKRGIAEYGKKREYEVVIADERRN